jgi:hypothetical protein
LIDLRMNIQKSRNDCSDRDEMRSSHHDHDNLHHAFSFMIFLE